MQDTCACITTTNETSMAIPTFSIMPDLDMALSTLSDIADIGQNRKLKFRPRNRKWKPEEKQLLTGSRWWSDFNGYHHIFDMPDLDMALSTRSDIGWHRKLKCRPRNRKWKWLLNGNIWRSDSNGYSHFIHNARLSYLTAGIARHRPTSGTQNVGQ